MTVKALIPVRTVNLVAPLPHKGTDMHITDTAAIVRAASGAASALNTRGSGLHSAMGTPPTPGIATSTTATRTTTTRATKALLWPSADSHLFELLVQAYLDCRRTKRNSASAQAFEARAEHNLYRIHEELATGQYQPGRSICFVITHPKPREVWAAQFRDRIVHHLLYNHIAPRFHARFVADSCACIPGRGTLYAADRLEHQVRSYTRNWSRPAHYLKCDLANFFVSIDKAVLLEQLQRQVTEPWWMALAQTILMHDPRHDVEVRKSAEFFASDMAGRIQRGRSHPSMLATQFKVGHRSWNAGRKGWQAGGRSAETRFKKGQMSGQAQHNYKPIGSLRLSKDGYLERKMNDTHPVPARRWVAVHRLVWEQAHGLIPAKHIVVFKPGQRTAELDQITVQRLECISRAEHAQRNHPRSKHPELGKLVQLKGAITRQVNRITREAKEAQA